MQLVGGPQQRSIMIAPSAVVNRQLGSPDLVGVDVAAKGNQGVLTELVLRVAPPTGSQDQQLPVAWRQRVLGQHMSREHQPTAH